MTLTNDSTNFNSSCKGEGLIDAIVGRFLGRQAPDIYLPSANTPFRLLACLLCGISDEFTEPHCELP